MKKFFKNKKVIIGLVVVILLIGAIAFELLIINKNKHKDDKVLQENTYTMYVKINPLIKLTFTESYYTCDKKICSSRTTEIDSLRLINDNAKDLYKNIDLIGISVEKSLDTIAELYMDKKKEKSIDMVVTTDWENYRDYKLPTKVKTKNLKLKVNYQKIIDEEKLFKEENINTFVVTFNSNGGNNVESEKVVEGESVSSPALPKRKGYIFVEWQLNGRAYDFTKPVTKDITLKAKWEIEKTEDDEIDTQKPTQNKTPNNSTTNDKDKKPINNNTNVDNKKPEDNSTNEPENKPEEVKCTAKKFDKKYSFVYDDKDACINEGNIKFMTLADTIDPAITGYDCEQIVDECGDKYWGIYFIKINDEEQEEIINY